MTRRPSTGRLWGIICEVSGVLLGLLFLVSSLFLLTGTLHYIGSAGYHINSAIGCALGVAVLLFLSICLALPSRLYEDRRLRIAGQLATSMTSAVTVASAVLPLVAWVLLWISSPSDGSEGADIAGIIVFFITVIGLATALVFLPCTCILAGKARMRVAHLAIGTIVAGAAGGLVGYLCY